MISAQQRRVSTATNRAPSVCKLPRVISRPTRKFAVQASAWGRDEEISLSKQAEEKAAMLLQQEIEAAPERPLVRFVLKSRIGMGEVFKIGGTCPELGRFSIEVAPTMSWSNGDVWTYETRMRPGTHKYKVLLRKADRSYTWEEREEDRVIEVRQGLTSADVIEVEVTNVKMNSFVMA